MQSSTFIFYHGLFLKLLTVLRNVMFVLINCISAECLLYITNLPEKTIFARFMKFLPGILLSLMVLASCSSKFEKVLKSKDKEYKLKMAEQYYAKKEYDKAQQLYT